MKSIRFVDFEVLIKEILMLDKNISLEKLNLFEIGLNSLQTMRIVNRLKQMGIVISFAELMEKPYIEKWWEILSERMSLEDALSSKILISKESNSLTDVQYAYWIGRGEKQILGGVSCHAYFEFKGLGLDTDKLKEAWYKIQQRHPMLRARFLENGTQQIIEQNKFSNELIIYDLREKQSEIEEHLLKIRTTNSHRVFDIEKGHVAALEVTIINNKEYVIHFDIDLLVADLKSIGIVLNDLAALYGDKYLPELPNNNVFVLSSGCFPGMTGVLLNFLCSQFDDVKSLSGMSISTEIPSQSAIEDFILTNIAGFGQPLKYYNNGEYVRDEQIFYEIVRNSEFKLQNYYTVELERVVKKYRPEKANWYNVLFAEEIMKKMQEAVVQFSARGYSDEFRRIVAEIKKIFADNVKNNEAFNFLKVEANGTKNGSVTGRKIEILNDSSSQISALIASHASIELLNKKIVPGIYYATDIIEGDIVLGDLPKLNIDLNISEYVMQEESFDDEFEEGTI